MIVLDSNILISIFNGHQASILFLRECVAREVVGISIITLAEILSGSDKLERKKIRNAVKDLAVIPFDRAAIAELTADFRRESGLATPDAIIAASCEYNGCDFYTYDKGFRKLQRSWIHVLEYQNLH